MIKAVIFDLWSTLASRGFSITMALNEHFSLGKSHHEIRRDYEEAINLKHFDTMEAMAESFLEKVGVEVNDENVKFIVDVHKKGIEQSELMPGIRELLDELREKYKIGLITNTSNFGLDITDKLEIKKDFDVIVASFEVGKLKPAKEIFEEAAKRLGVDVSECLFVDDYSENVKGAIDAGMKGLLFESSGKLKEEIKKMEN